MSYFKRILQDIQTSTVNTTEANLAVAATFTGTAEETFGINGIQVYHTADQECTVYLDQGVDGLTWGVTDTFTVLANEAGTRTYTSVAPYFRMRVTNTGLATTTVLSTACGMTPIINPLPRALSDDGRLMTEATLTGSENTDRHAWITPTGALTATPTTRLVGTNLDGATKDTNFWTETVTNGGTITQLGEVLLETNTTANGTTRYQTKQDARFVVGAPNRFLGFFKNESAPLANNERRAGAYDGTEGVDGNGFFFQVSGTTFGVGTRKAGVDTIVENGSFNGNYGATFTPVLDTLYKSEIEYGIYGAYWYINDTLLHKKVNVNTTDSRLVNALTLPVTIENNNSGGNDVNSIFAVYGAAILRQGQLLTNPSSYYHASGTTAGVTLKYGPGTIHTVIFGGAANNVVVTLADSTSAATPILWLYDATGALDSPVSVDMGGLPFSHGLRLVVASGNATCTIVYE